MSDSTEREWDRQAAARPGTRRRQGRPSVFGVDAEGMTTITPPPPRPDTPATRARTRARAAKMAAALAALAAAEARGDGDSGDERPWDDETPEGSEPTEGVGVGVGGRGGVDVGVEEEGGGEPGESGETGGMSLAAMLVVALLAVGVVCLLLYALTQVRPPVFGVEAPSTPNTGDPFSTPPPPRDVPSTPNTGDPSTDPHTDPGVALYTDPYTDPGVALYTAPGVASSTIHQRAT